MSLALFIYNPASEDAKSKDSDHELKNSSSADSSTGNNTSQQNLHQAANKSGHFFETTDTVRPRSLAFPSTVAVALLVLVLSILKSTLVEANSEYEQTISQNLTHCQQSPTIDSRITCPLDLIPGATLASARIEIESRTAADNLGHCTLFARSATTGRARGVSVKATKQNTAIHNDDLSAVTRWLDFPKLSTQPDDFRYVVCDLTGGAHVTGLEVTLDNRATPSALELKRMINKQLTLARQSDAATIPSSTR